MRLWIAVRAWLTALLAEPQTDEDRELDKLMGEW